MITSVIYHPENHLPLQAHLLVVVPFALLTGVTPPSPVMDAEFFMTPTVSTDKVAVIVVAKLLQFSAVTTATITALFSSFIK